MIYLHWFRAIGEVGLRKEVLRRRDASEDFGITVFSYVK